LPNRYLFGFHRLQLSPCSLAGNCVAAGYFKNINANVSYEAFTQTQTDGIWETANPATFTYTVTYDYSSATGGNNSPTGRFTTGGTAITLPTPVRTGYIFSGWYSDSGFIDKIGDAGASYSPTGLTLALNAYAKWTIDSAYVAAQAAAAQAEAARVAAANLAAAELASRTISAKKKFAIKPLAKQVGVSIVYSKAKVTFKVAKSSKKICTKSGSKLKTLKAGNCIVTFTVQEPKPKKGKKPKATKTVKTFIVQ
jgi:uncharacterized repeat protein (TIGR02543 family)